MQDILCDCGASYTPESDSTCCAVCAMSPDTRPLHEWNSHPMSIRDQYSVGMEKRGGQPHQKPSQRSHRPHYFRGRKCDTCGKKYTPTGPKNKYCVSCREIYMADKKAKDRNRMNFRMPLIPGVTPLGGVCKIRRVTLTEFSTALADGQWTIIHKGRASKGSVCQIAKGSQERYAISTQHPSDWFLSV